ncbi:MAG: hypothetical protein U0X91_12130 [Spirosomataceae bacterium]
MKLTLIALFTAFSLSLQAQCRPATEAENQAYERVVKELQRQFTSKMPNGNWKVFDENHSMGSLEVTSEWGGFVHLCTDRYDLIMERADITAARKAQTDTTNKPQVSLYVPRDTMYRENPNAIAERSDDTYTVSVEMNLGNYRLQDMESARWVENSQAISVPGAPVALEVRLKPDLRGAVGRQETVILLGGWNAKPVQKGADTRYQPHFKKGGKLVENLAITITAPFDLARQIVKQIDWSSINGVLLK